MARRDGVVCKATASGQDIYAISAPIVVEAAVRLIEEATPDASGAFPLAQRFDARAFLRAIEPYGLEVGWPQA